MKKNNLDYLKELARKINEKPFHVWEIANRHISIEFADEALGSPDYYSVFDYDKYERQGRLCSYYLCAHYCTDSVVGTMAHILDGDIVAISVQLGRKSSFDIGWVSKNLRKKTIKFLETFLIKQDDEFELMSDETIGALEQLEKGYKLSCFDELCQVNFDAILVTENGEENVTIPDGMDGIPDFKRYHKDRWKYDHVNVDLKDGTRKEVLMSDLRFKMIR